MFGLTPLGTFHTAVSLVAVAAGVIALIRDKEISWRTGVGKTYIVTTVIVCLTGFGIFQHGGFGKAHVLGIITLLVIGLAALAGRQSFGRASRYIETLGYSLTLFFHMIPAITETATRLPLGAPLEPNGDAPAIQKAIGLAFVVFLVIAALQLLRLRRNSRTQPV